MCVPRILCCFSLQNNKQISKCFFFDRFVYFLCGKRKAKETLTNMPHVCGHIITRTDYLPIRMSSSQTVIETFIWWNVLGLIIVSIVDVDFLSQWSMDQALPCWICNYSFLLEFLFQGKSNVFREWSFLSMKRILEFVTQYFKTKWQFRLESRQFLPCIVIRLNLNKTTYSHRIWVRKIRGLTIVSNFEIYSFKI